MQEKRNPPKKEDSEITDYEREQLKELIQHPGWPVYEKIVDGFLAAVKAGTEVNSLNDPLTNKDQLANMWAYYKMMVMIKHQTKAGIQRELDWLISKGANQRTPEEESERRRIWFGLGQIGEPPENWEPSKH